MENEGALGWLVHSTDHTTLAFGAVSLSPMLGMEIT